VRGLEFPLIDGGSGALLQLQWRAQDYCSGGIVRHLQKYPVQQHSSQMSPQMDVLQRPPSTKRGSMPIHQSTGFDILLHPIISLHNNCSTIFRKRLHISSLCDDLSSAHHPSATHRSQQEKDRVTELLSAAQCDPENGARKAFPCPAPDVSRCPPYGPAVRRNHTTAVIE
jgi:hypothetical protein